MLFLLLQMIPAVFRAIAIFVLSQSVGLINSHLALVLIYVGGMILMNTADERVSRRDPQKIWMSPPAWMAPAALHLYRDHHAVVEAHPRGGGAFLLDWAAGIASLQHHPAYPG